MPRSMIDSIMGGPPPPSPSGSGSNAKRFNDISKDKEPLEKYRSGTPATRRSWNVQGVELSQFGNPFRRNK